MARLFFNPAYERQLASDVLRGRQTFSQMVQQVTAPGFGVAYDSHAAAYPHAGADVLYGLTSAGIPAGDPVADRIAEMSLQQRLAEDPSFGIPKGSAPVPAFVKGAAAQRGTGPAGIAADFGKGLVRGAFMGLSAPVQELGNVITSAGEAAMDDEDGFFADAWRNFIHRVPRSDLAMAIGETYARIQNGEMDLTDRETWRDLIQGDPEFIGTGFLPGGEIAARREAQKHNLQLSGQFLTPGRTILEFVDRGDVIEEGSSAYNWISGAADAAFQIFGDPANAIPAAGFARKARMISEGADLLPEVVRQGDAVADAGVFAERMRSFTLHTPRRMIDREGAEAFLSGGSPEVNLLVAGLTQESNAYRIHQVFNGQIGERMATRLADATRPEDVVGELRRALDDFTVAGLPHLSRRQARTVRAGMRSPEPTRPVLRRSSDRFTFATAVPDRSAIISVNNLAEGADNLARWYRAGQSQLSGDATTNIDRAEEFADRIMRIRPGVDAQSKVGEVLREAMDDLAGRMVGDRPELKAQLSLSPDYVAAQRAFMWDAGGREIERPGLRYRTEVDGVTVERTLQEGEALGPILAGGATVMPNAAMVSQLATAGHALPDWKQVRRATSRVAHLGPLADLGYNVTDVARSYLQPLWMNAVLLRPAVTFRIMLDAQLRMGFDGVASVFRHPVEFISYLIGRKGNAPIEGGLWDDHQSFLDSLEGLSSLKDVGGMRVSRTLSNDFVEHSRHADSAAWLDAITARIALMAQDPIMRYFAGHTTEETAEWLTSGAGRRHLDVLNTQALDGAIQSRTGVDQLLSAYTAHLDQMTGGSNALKADIAQGRVAGVSVAPDFSPLTQETVTGRLRQLPSSRYFDEARDALAGQADLLRVLPDRVYGSRPLRGLGESDGGAVARRLAGVRDWLFDALMSRPENLLSRSVTYRARYFDTIENLLPRTNRAEAEHIIKQMREVSGVGGKLDKAGRQQLHRMEAIARTRKAGDLDESRVAALSRLAGSEASRHSLELLYDYTDRAVWEDAASLAAPFVAVWRDTLKTYFHPTKGLITTNPAVARRAMQTVRSAQLADPDGDGRGFIWENDQGEEMFTIPNWTMAVAMGAIGGGIGAAAGNLAGRTAAFAGQRVLPAVAQQIGTRALTGAGAVAGGAAGLNLLNTATDLGNGAQVAFTGRASGLNVVTATVLPGAGPVVQMPLAFVTENMPGLDWLWRIVHPYGRPDVEGGVLESLMPAWTRRFATALRNDPESVRLFGNTVGDVANALLASGRYSDDNGFINEDERNRLLKDATSRARALFFVRGFAQTSLPTGPQIEFTANTSEGEISFYALSDEFRRMRDTYGPDAAMGEFIARYGVDLLAVTIPKSRTVRARSFDPAGANWERQNPDLVRDYANTVAFFAPDAQTGEFDFQAYNRAIARGDQVDLSPADRVRLLNNFIGSAFIRAQKNLMGNEASTQQGRIYLADTRAALREAFPGYGATDNLPSTINTDAAIAELANAVSDPRLQDHPLTGAIAQMLALREQGIAAGRAMGATQFQTATSIEFVQLRDAYRAEADRIIQEVPDFAEVWRLVFERELADDVEAPEFDQPLPYATWQGPPTVRLTTR